MTLSTDVYVLDEVSPQELFTYCQTLLSKYDEQHRGPERQRSKHRQDQYARSFDNEPDQGLPAWLMLDYGLDGPLRTAEQAAECSDHCDPDCTRQYHDRACWAKVDFDTAYSYRGPGGIGCGDLHASLVAEVGKWLDERGVRWEWRNEFSGEVHGGDERYARLIDICTEGFAAQAWFLTAALPAIASHIAREESS